MSCPASLGVIATMSMRRRLRAFVTVVALLFLSVIETAHADLISNGSFEIPILPPSSNSSIPGGSTFITGWTVLGNNVSLTTSPFAEGPILLNPQSGNQFVDVSGFLNTPIDGIEQIVPTLGGQEYTLSF